ncbi:MAG: Mur ligase domain-containing protein [Deltaproteobacteria bacterium]|jgi:UDP-N-acetylmuramate: L-alanyl-gamma-D-glutamyl-meso-diaminopimelate ligase|nr:Mur ligase domain-containing protein [Deltaproteobacteria bacterium]
MDGGCLWDLDPELNRLPEGFLARGWEGGPRRPREVFLLGVGGVAMASLAGLLQAEGYAVSGADEGLYPPMKELVEGLGIPVHRGYGADCLAGSPDLVVVGNVVTRRFPAAAELARRAIPYVSLPQCLSELFLKGSRNLVISGCHGKTTLTALCARLLEAGGLDPGFLVGGASLDSPLPFRRGGGGLFVIEGDEYDCAFFDKRPKFVHYRPRTVILTSIEYDHADIYPDLASVFAAYRTLAGLVPEGGLLVANGDDPLCREAASACRGRVEFYGEGDAPGGAGGGAAGGPLHWRLAGFSVRGFRSEFEIRGPDGASYRLAWPRLGRYNALGACAAAAACLDLGVDPGSLPAAFAGFRGVRRRQEPLFDSWAPEGEGGGVPDPGWPGPVPPCPDPPARRRGPRGVTVVDDFAHHPTAVAKTLGALREAFPGRRLVAAFEPRSNTSRRAVFQEEYPGAFAAADLVLLSGVDRPDKAPEGDRLDLARLARDIGSGRCLACPDPEAVLREALSAARPGDLFCVMSNGSFGAVASRLADYFRGTAGGGPAPAAVGL